MEQFYRCILCHQIIDEEELPTHLLIHLEGKLAHCSLCLKGFLTKEEMIKHLLSHVANIIHAVDASDPDSIHENGPRAVHEAGTSRKWHQEVFHRDKDVKAMTMDECEKESLTSANSTSPYILCKFCGQAFSSIPLLRSHLDQDHRHEDVEPNYVSERFKCRKCRCLFKTESQLQEHMKTHVVYSQCRHCGSVFYSAWEKQKHHSGKCEICGMLFTCENHLTTHVCKYLAAEADSLSGNKSGAERKAGQILPFICTFCKERFPSALEKQEHRNSKCRICGTVFSCKVHLTDHEAIHRGKEPHRCDICGETFTHRTNLLNHSQLHVVNKWIRKVSHIGVQNICKYCSQAFSHATLLKSHQAQCQKAGKESSGSEENYACSQDGFRSDKDSEAISVVGKNITKINSGPIRVSSVVGGSGTAQSPRLSTGNSALPASSECKSEIHAVHSHCTYCGADIKNKWDSNKHKNAKCKICGAVFECKAHLTTHRASHIYRVSQEDLNLPRSVSDRTAYRCIAHWCRCQFQTESELQKHMKRHTIQWKCTYCGADFHNMWEKYKHTNSKCKICGKTFICDSHVRLHEGAHTGDVRHRCEECGRVFTQRQSLLDHQQRRHKVSHECKYCTLIFYSSESLARHQDQCRGHNDMDVMETVGDCGKAPSSTLSTASSESETEIKRWTCAECSETFTTSEAIGEHSTRGCSPHHCSYCGEGFDTEADKRKHGNSKCKICGTVFICESHLTTHTAASHCTVVTDKPDTDTHIGFQCICCGLKFETENELEIHTETHRVTVKQNPCAHCEARFSNEVDEQRHKNCKCKICGTVFKCESLLTVHEASCEDMYACDVCAMAYTQKEALLEHKLTHQKMMYVCKYCRKNYASCKGLVTHLQLEHKDLAPVLTTTYSVKYPPYICEICEECFNLRPQLQGHKLTHDFKL